MIPWRQLRIHQTYYTKMFGPTFGVPNEYRKITITDIHIISESEAMIMVRYEDRNLGFAVGGIFEGVLGPRHRFWKKNPESYTHSRPSLPRCASAA